MFDIKEIEKFDNYPVHLKKEIGEELMLQALDTTRNAKKIDFDELERKEKLKD